MEIIWNVENRVIDGVGLVKKGIKYNVKDKLGEQLIKSKLAKKAGKSKGGK